MIQFTNSHIQHHTKKNFGAHNPWSDKKQITRESIRQCPYRVYEYQLNLDSKSRCSNRELEAISTNTNNSILL